MSLVIQLSKQQQNKNQEQENFVSIRKNLLSSGFFDSNCLQQYNPCSLNYSKVLDIVSNYKLILRVNFQKDFLKLITILIKDNTSIIVSDKKLKLILVRLVPKYYSKNALVTIISAQGQLVTKRIINLSRDNYAELNQQKNAMFKSLQNYIAEFVNQSSQFYKNVIIKLQKKSNEIMKLKPKYFESVSKSIKICNLCYQPTYQMFKKNPIQCKFLSKLQRKNNERQFIEQFQNKEEFLYNQNDYISINSIIQSNNCSQDQKSNFYEWKDKNFNLKTIYQELFNLYQNGSNQLKANFKRNDIHILQNYKKTFISNLQIHYFKKDSSVKEQIYNEIQIKNHENIHWQNFQMTSFSNLKIAKIKYLNKTLRQKNTQLSNISKKQKLFPNFDHQILSVTVVLKSQSAEFTQKYEKSKLKGRLKWQKNIIRQIFSNDHCAYLPKFYSTSQNISNSTLQISKSQFMLIQYIKKGTLRSWLNDNFQTNSIYTKINVILYIMYGLRFIHSKKTLHMDLKPINILMDKNLTAKITDFGSAYNKEVYQKMKRQKINYFLSFSIPYTAPQIFMKSKKPSLNPKCDIFSLGLIIYQIIFNQNIFKQGNQKLSLLYQQIGWLLENQDSPQNRYQSCQNRSQKYFQRSNQQYLSQKIFFCPENIAFDGSFLYQSFVNIIFKSLSCYHEKRPHLDFLIIAVKQIYHSFLQYYSW